MNVQAVQTFRALLECNNFEKLEMFLRIHLDGKAMYAPGTTGAYMCNIVTIEAINSDRIDVAQRLCAINWSMKIYREYQRQAEATKGLLAIALKNSTREAFDAYLETIGQIRNV